MKSVTSDIPVEIPQPLNQAALMPQAPLMPEVPSSLVSSFKPKDQSVMAMAYGGAQAPGTAFRMEDDSPIGRNAFIGALEAAKASGETSFNVNGNTYPVK